MKHREQLRALLFDDPLRMAALGSVAALPNPNCWIAAGFVRDAVWDHLHGHDLRAPVNDVDVIWFDANDASAAIDRRLEDDLTARVPVLAWSVKNQARMHRANGDAPYMSLSDAMRHWPETATAVAVRLGAKTEIEIEVEAPFGLHDLFALRLRPTEAFAGAKHQVFRSRVSSKQWIERYPLLVTDDGR